MPTRKSSSKEETIDIWGTEEGETRGNGWSWNSVAVTTLTASMKDFVQKIDTLIGELPQSTQDFQLDAIELQLSVSSTGKVGLLGMGMEGQQAGGIRLILKKRRNRTDLIVIPKVVILKSFRCHTTQKVWGVMTAVKELSFGKQM